MLLQRLLVRFDRLLACLWSNLIGRIKKEHEGEGCMLHHVKTCGLFGSLWEARCDQEGFDMLLVRFLFAFKLLDELSLVCFLLLGEDAIVNNCQASGIVEDELDVRGGC